MRRPRLDRIVLTPALRIAAACAAIALLADVALLARMAYTPAESPVVPLRLAPAPAIVRPSSRELPGVESAAESDPFEPLGAPQQLASAEVVPQAAAPTAQPRLVGTVVRDTESFVVMAMPEGTIKVVRVGERAGDLRLRSVSAGGAVFDDITKGERVTLRAPTPGAEPHPLPTTVGAAPSWAASSYV
jgi:hypothetical protein